MKKAKFNFIKVATSELVPEDTIFLASEEWVKTLRKLEELIYKAYELPKELCELPKPSGMDIFSRIKKCG